jgi:hypothetical protein
VCNKTIPFFGEIITCLETELGPELDDILYRQLSFDDLTPDMLTHFNRYQKVEKNWKKQNGGWVLVNNPHVINWDEAKKHKNTNWRRTIFRSSSIPVALFFVPMTEIN